MTPLDCIDLCCGEDVCCSHQDRDVVSWRVQRLPVSRWTQILLRHDQTLTLIAPSQSGETAAVLSEAKGKHRIVLELGVSSCR